MIVSVLLGCKPSTYKTNHRRRTEQVGLPAKTKPTSLAAACPARHKDKLKRRAQKNRIDSGCTPF